MQPTAFLQRFRRHSSGTCVGWISMRCNMMPLIDTCPFKNLRDAVCDKLWLLIQWVQPLEDCSAICPHKRVLNRYGKCCAYFFPNRAASKAACSSSFGTGSVFIGVTRAVPITNASPVRLLSDGGLTSARKNATALKTSWELSPNTCYSRSSKGPEKQQRGMVNKASVGNSELQEENRSNLSLGSFLFQLWPSKW